jgi:hypothetical protein
LCRHARRLTRLLRVQMTHLLSVLRAQVNMQANLASKIAMLNVRAARGLPLPC